MKKFISFVICLLVGFAFASPMFATENNPGSLGIRMYKFKKPRIAKGLVIIEVFPETPAWSAGIRMADRVFKINDIDVQNMSVSEAQMLLAGKVGDSVKVTLLTRNGIQDFNIQRAKVDFQNITSPRWYQYCGNKKTEDELCYIHPGQYKMKVSDWFKIMGPYGVNAYGVPLAYQRYQFEDNLKLCQSSKDKSMCYLEVGRIQENRIIAQRSLQLQQAQLLNQTLNGLNNDLNQQMINNNLNNVNNNLYNINNSVRNLRY